MESPWSPVMTTRLFFQIALGLQLGEKLADIGIGLEDAVIVVIAIARGVVLRSGRLIADVLRQTHAYAMHGHQVKV